MDFNEIIGHDRQIENLRNAIRKDNISHSYLFEGEEGLGKKKTALAFSKTLLCKEEKDHPCNICSSCVKFDSGNHPDFKLIVPNEKGTIVIGEIEKIINAVSTSPFEGKRKVFIIDDSHTINIEAMNTLLKTLEEPPSFMNIILVTSISNKLLPTILSRCQRIRFYPVENSKIIKLLEENKSLDKDKSAFIADFTKGSIGKSIEISDSEDFFNRRDEVIAIIDNILKGDETKALASVNFFNENKGDIESILDIMLYWFRDLLIYKEVGRTNLIMNKDKLEILSKQSSIDFNKINDIIEKIGKTRVNINDNVNFTLSIETMLLKI